MNEFDIPPGNRLIICGDTHGFLHSVMGVFEQAGYPDSDDKVLYVSDCCSFSPLYCATNRPSL